MIVNRYIIISLCALFLITACSNTNNKNSKQSTITHSKLKIKNIRVQGKHAVIEEKKRGSISSEYKISHHNKPAYNLVASHGEQVKQQSTHRNQSDMMIPSWKVHSW